MKGFVIPAFFIIVLFGIASAALIGFLGNFIVDWMMNWIWKFLIIGVGVVLFAIVTKLTLSGNLTPGKTFGLMIIGVITIALMIGIFNDNIRLFSISYNPSTQSIITGNIPGTSISFDVGVLIFGTLIVLLTVYWKKIKRFFK